MIHKTFSIRTDNEHQWLGMVNLWKESGYGYERNLSVNCFGRNGIIKRVNMASKFFLY